MNNNCICNTCILTFLYSCFMCIVKLYLNFTVVKILQLLEPNNKISILSTAVQISFTQADVRVNEDNGRVFVCLVKDRQTVLDIELQLAAREQNPSDARCEFSCLLITSFMYPHFHNYISIFNILTIYNLSIYNVYYTLYYINISLYI